jgi:cell division septum initiation protein DivIVA
MDNQRDRQPQFSAENVEYMRKFWRTVDMESVDLDLDDVKNDIQAYLEEIERLQQRLTYYEGCKGIEEYYAAVSKCRELTAQVSQLREERQKHIDALKEIRDLGTSSNYTVNVAVLTAQAALGIGE